MHEGSMSSSPSLSPDWIGGCVQPRITGMKNGLQKSGLKIYIYIYIYIVELTKETLNDLSSITSLSDHSLYRVLLG